MIRVLLLAPWLAWVSHREHREAEGRASLRYSVLPPYLVAFLCLALLRTSGVIPESVATPVQRASHLLTVVSMAGLGLAVEPGSLRRVGRATFVSALGALIALCALAVIAVRFVT